VEEKIHVQEGDLGGDVAVAQAGADLQTLVDDDAVGDADVLGA